MAQAGMPFGERLRRLREGRGLTQEELAEGAGLSPQAVASLERGRRSRPYPHTVRALADALGLADEERRMLFESVARHPAAATAVEPAPAQLPVPPTPLIGREQAVGELGELLAGADGRLLTLIGPGGVGKTRLALAVARDAAGRFPDGVAFVPLAPVGDPALVLPAIARSLGVAEVPGRTPLATLTSCLRDRRMLLVHDNFERVLDAATVVADLIASCPHLRVLVTSRAPLRVRGEREYHVGPLPVPAIARTPAVGEVAASAAVRLFVDRARASSPTFALTRSNAAAVAAIARRLDGLPLAIELAAARIRSLSPAELLARLDRSLPLLTGGARDLPERQRTMRAAIAWSYELLEGAERRLLDRLSVFAGGWDLEAAEAVGSGGGIVEEEVVGLLSSLVEQSLVVTEGQDDGTTRYRLLAPVREYAEERLERSGEARETRRRHAGYFLALAGRAEPGLQGPTQGAWLDRLEREHDNIRATMAWWLERGDPEAATRFGFQLWLFWWMRGHFGEGRRWMGAILAGDPPPPARARALLVLSSLAYGQADYAWAAPVADESLALFRSMRDGLGIALATGVAGLVAVGRNEYGRGAALLEEAASGCLREGDTFHASILLAYSVVIPLGRGDHARAARLNEQALALARARGDSIGAYAALYNLANMARMRGDHGEAARLLKEALALSAQLGEKRNSAHGLEGLAWVAASRGSWERAATLWGAAQMLLESGEAARYANAPERALDERAMAAGRSQLGGRVFEAAWAAGLAMTPEQAVAYALSPDERPGPR